MLELEENIRRKDLTEYEKNKAMVEYVEAVKEEAQELRTESVQKAPGRPPDPASERSIAERTSILASTTRDAESHIETADAFPFMQS